MLAGNDEGCGAVAADQAWTRVQLLRHRALFRARARARAGAGAGAGPRRDLLRRRFWPSRPVCPGGVRSVARRVPSRPGRCHGPRTARPGRWCSDQRRSGASELTTTESGCRHGRPVRIMVAQTGSSCDMTRVEVDLRRSFAFEIDLEHCWNCGGQLKPIAASLDSALIEQILTHLGLQTDCGRMAARRRGPRRVSVRWRKPPDRGSTVPVYPSNRPSTASGRWGRLRPGPFEADKHAMVLQFHPWMTSPMDRRRNVSATWPAASPTNAAPQAQMPSAGRPRVERTAFEFPSARSDSFMLITIPGIINLELHSLVFAPHRLVSHWDYRPLSGSQHVRKENLP